MQFHYLQIRHLSAGVLNLSFWKWASMNLIIPYIYSAFYFLVKQSASLPARVGCGTSFQSMEPHITHLSLPLSKPLMKSFDFPPSAKKCLKLIDSLEDLFYRSNDLLLWVLGQLFYCVARCVKFLLQYSIYSLLYKKKSANIMTVHKPELKHSVLHQGARTAQ